MNLPQLKKFLKSSKKSDRWWVALGDNVLDDVKSLSDLPAMRAKYPDWEICLLHESQADGDSPEWLLLTDEVVDTEHNPFRPAGPLQAMGEHVARLQQDLADAKRIVEILRRFTEFDETHARRQAELEERERYIEESEEALMEKAQRLEVLRVELEHKAEGAKYLKQSA